MTGIVLVHVVEGTSGAMAIHWATSYALARGARLVLLRTGPGSLCPHGLEAAVHEASARLGDGMTWHVLRDCRVADMVRAAELAEVVVLPLTSRRVGRDLLHVGVQRSFPPRRVSVLSGVPVVVLPWRGLPPPEGAPAEAPVVAGVGDGIAASAPLLFAREEALRASAPLVLLRAVDRSARTGRVGAAVERLAHSPSPGPRVVVRTVEGQVVPVLLEATHTARLLVLGSGGAGRVIPSHLSVVDAVLRETASPVAVVPATCRCRAENPAHELHLRSLVPTPVFALRDELR